MSRRASASGSTSSISAEYSAFSAARELIEELKRRNKVVVLASSAKAHEVEHYLDLLDLRRLADGWTTSADVEATKPEPDLIKAATEKAGTHDAVMVGDSTWDCVAAEKAGLRTVGVLTGGFSEQELRDAGAAEVYESLAQLLPRLDAGALA